MNTIETSSNTVCEHYSQPDLETAIRDALVAGGKDPQRLTTDDLIAIDEFHVRGRSATADLARDIEFDSSMQVLDVGCGLGGASRYLAKEFGCRVTGVDLNGEYCRIAEGFARNLGLESLVSYRQGNAVALPFPDASFDVVWTQHASMNIEDKALLYREIWRVLKPKGRFALYDVLAGPGGDVHYPVPWAREPSISHLITSRDLLDLLSEIGFQVLVWRNVTEPGRLWFRRMQGRLSGQAQPDFGLHLLLGQDFRRMAHNQALNLEEDRIALIEAVVRRPGVS